MLNAELKIKYFRRKIIWRKKLKRYFGTR